MIVLHYINTKIIKRGKIMKKITLLSMLSMLFYSAPGYTGGGQSKPAAPPEEPAEVAEAQFEVGAPPQTSILQEAQAAEEAEKARKTLIAEEIKAYKHAIAINNSEASKIFEKLQENQEKIAALDLEPPEKPGWKDYLTPSCLKGPSERERLQMQRNELLRQQQLLRGQRHSLDTGREAKFFEQNIRRNL